MGTIYLGVDPGKAGAIAALYPNGTADAWDMPEDARGIADCLRDVVISAASNKYRIIAAVEKVGAMPGQGVVSMFTFGRGVGWVEGCLASSYISTTMVTPQKWQREVFDSAKKPENRKMASLELARRLFPHVTLHRKKDHGKAEALLIALWLERQTEGRPK